MGRRARVRVTLDGTLVGLRRRISAATRERLRARLERYRAQYQHLPWQRGQVTNAVGPKLGSGRGDRSSAGRAERLTTAELEAAIAGALAYRQAHRERRAHAWWGRRPTWRKRVSAPTLAREFDAALGSRDPECLLAALERYAKLTGELPEADGPR